MELDELLEDFKKYHNAIKEVNISDWKEALGILASPLSKVEVKEDGSIGSVIEGKYGKAYSYLLDILTEYEAMKKQAQEFGCPLDILLKLTKQEKVNFKGQMVDYYVFYNTLTNRFEIRNEDTTDLTPLAAYKKTWWLRETKEE